jgi:sodium/potassium/calcium exchanger 2
VKLRQTKRLARKYSLAFLAVALAIIALWDAVVANMAPMPQIDFPVDSSIVDEVMRDGSDSTRQKSLRHSGASRFLEDSAVDPPDQFTNEERRKGAVILHCMGLFYMFVAIAIVCDECFVPALEVITEVLDLSPDVAGATFMAAGGSAPEFFTSLIGAMISESDIGTGTIIGSAVFNVLFVIGACALVAPEPLQLTWFPLARDSIFYAIDLIVVTATFLDEKIKWYEAVVLFILYLCYTIFMKFNEQIQAWAIGGAEQVEEVGDELKDADEKDDDNTWAKSRDQNNSPPPEKSISAGTGEGGDPSTMQKKSQRNSASNDRPFRHKSIRVNAHHPSPTGSTNIASQKNEDISVFGTQECHEAGHHDSTGGSADPPEPPCMPAPKMADWHLTDVVPTPHGSGEGAGAHKTTSEGEGDGDDEENEPLSIMPPEDNNVKDWIWYVVSIPIVFCLVFTVPDVRREGWREWYAVTFFNAIAWIAAFTWVMVWFATAIAETCGIEEHIMGLTILAAGTSVPDLLTSMIVARQGHGDMAISSSIGSNIFDVTVGLPVPWMVYHIIKKEDVEIKNEGLEITVMLLLGMLGFTIGTILFHNWVMTKWMGSSLLFLYLLFEVIAVWLTTAPEGSLKIIHA